MIASAGFAYVFAKVHGMRSRLWEGARLKTLTALRSPGEMAATVFPRLEERSLRGFEQRLVSEHVRSLDFLQVLADGPAKHFFAWQLERYRIENVKTLLRAWKARQSVEQVRPFLVELPDRYSLPVDKLLATTKLAEFARALPVPRFAEGLERGAARFQDTESLFYVESGLDAVYFAELCRRAVRLERADRLEVARPLRMEMLVYNVLFAMRARLNYGLPPEDVNDCLARGPMPAPTGARYEPMLRAEGFAAMLAAMPDRKILLGTGPDPASIAELQRRTWERLFLVANSSFYRSTLHMGCVEAFYYIKRVELANLIRVAELLRQGKSGPEIESELIRLPAG